jgi:hypothetical protein
LLLPQYSSVIESWGACPADDLELLAIFCILVQQSNSLQVRPFFGADMHVKPTPNQLRSYQVKLLTDVSRAAAGNALIEQPTGSGKTLQIVTLVAMHLGRRFHHAVIAAPQEQIEHGFVHRDYQSVAFPECRGVAVPAVEVSQDLIWGARQSELGSVKRLLAYLRQSGPLDHALACTHAALNYLTPDKLPRDLLGKALFIDEAHHASADGLSEIVSIWRERGGQLFFFTATPYRGDGRAVALDGMRLFRRSLAEHMDDGYAPRHLDSEIVALGRPGDTVTAAQFTGEDAPPPSYLESLVTAICRKWQDDGRPKAIVRVPPMRGGSEGLVARLSNALSERGASLLNATGTRAEDKKRFLRALKAESRCTHAESQYDVMIGIQRVLEGTDWPVCSAVYCVGMPGSLNTVVQLLGRAMRPKGDDYPAGQRDRARLVFFVPCAGGSALADLSMDHSRHALLTCCFLADHEVGQEWIVLREVRRGIEDALGPRAENSAAAEAENAADEALDPEVRAEVELAMTTAREEIIGKGGEPTIGEVLKLAAKTRPDLPAAALQRVATEILASQPGSSGETARETIHQEIAKRLRIDPMVKKAMEEAFAVVLGEFRDVTLKDSPALESVRRQVHGVTGGQMREFAERLRNLTPQPLTEEQILAWADAEFERTGKWPKEDSGPIWEVSGETWKAIHMALVKGGRGLPGGSSLPRLLAKERGVRNHLAVPRLTKEQILAWADAHYEFNGQWPKADSGPIVGASNETWSGINHALKRGTRGLHGKSSLARLLADERQVPNASDGRQPNPRRKQAEFPILIEDLILGWADAYYSREDRWPSSSSGSVLGAPGETWSAINHALCRGRRGLSAGSSLAKLLQEKRKVRNVQNVPQLTRDTILEWADAHYRRTGNWPSLDSGPIFDVPGETWSGVNAALYQGSRGLLGGSSLAILLQEECRKRNQKSLPRLTTEQVLVWAEGHRKRTGEWPRHSSGTIQDTLNEKWVNIDQALRKGLRGLPGGSSLARLIESHRSCLPS